MNFKEGAQRLSTVLVFLILPTFKWAAVLMSYKKLKA